MSIRVYIKIYRVSMVASGIVTNTFENDFRFQNKLNFSGTYIYTIFWSLNFWKSPFHSRIKDHEDGNMLDNFYNNKLIDLNFKTKSLYLLSDIENLKKKTRYYLNYLPWSFDGHGPMKILWFQHGGHSVLRKLNIWSTCHCSIQVRKYCIRK